MTLIATILGSSLAFLDVTVVIVALPTIEKDLNLGLAGEQWIYLSYSLALASLYLVAGAVGDRRGRRERAAAIDDPQAGQQAADRLELVRRDVVVRDHVADRVGDRAEDERPEAGACRLADRGAGCDVK